jgi:hypothetical protein
MKKILLNFALLLTCTITAFSQNEIEKKLAVKPLELVFENSITSGKIDCNCTENILRDGGFENLSVNPGGSDITGSSAPWKKNTYTPQWSPNLSCCNKGIVSMWGNKTVGESIIQNGIGIVNGQTYTIKVTARFANPTTLSTFVRLKVSAFNGTGTTSYNVADVIGVTSNITSTSCATYTFTWTATGNFNSIQLHPENDYTQDDGNYVSWIQIDNICIEKTCKIPDEKCNPKFTTAPFTVNSQCNVVVNVNPVVTNGATHYWGLLGAASVSDNTPIPLSTILSGGSFGLGITSTGLATPIGMGTGITASTSGYGYQYSGVSFGQCFKITHYIKCCDKWYSQTNTYCTKLCSDVKESALTEVQVSDDIKSKVRVVEIREGH